MIKIEITITMHVEVIALLLRAIRDLILIISLF